MRNQTGETTSGTPRTRPTGSPAPIWRRGPSGRSSLTLRCYGRGPERILLMQPWSGTLAGRLDEHVIDSAELRGNPLGDPHRRPLWVYVPPGYDDEPDRRYPAVYMIQGYTGSLPMWRNPPPWPRPLPGLAADVAHPPAVAAALPGAGRPGLRARRCTAGDRGLRRRLDGGRRQP